MEPELTSEATQLIRGGLVRSGFDETAEALYLTSGYVYGSAAEAEAAFAGEVDHYIYSRYGNPTVTTFEERLRLLEGAEACLRRRRGWQLSLLRLPLRCPPVAAWLRRGRCLARAM